MVQYGDDDFDITTVWREKNNFGSMPKKDMQQLKNDINIYRKRLININIEDKLILPLRLFDTNQKKLVELSEINIISNINFEYGIISYVWNKHYGKSPKNIIEEILCESTKQCNNLPRFFWMDALCINQQDIDEKISEIKKMKYYYQNASICVI